MAKETIKFEVLGQIPSMKNRVRFAGGRAFYANNEVARYKASFASQTPARFKKNLACPVFVDLELFLKDRRKDASNLTAACYDALEWAGVIKNDRQIVAGCFTSHIDKNNPRVKVIVYEVKQSVLTSSGRSRER